MASAFVEKVQVAVVTATLVSAGWIMAGAVLLDREESAEIADELDKQAEADPADEEEIAEQAGAAPAPGDIEKVEVFDDAQANTLLIPVQGVAATDLVDTFEDERGGGTRLHEAIDIMANTGTSVLATAPGTVERLFRSNAGGNTVYIRSEDGRTIYYYAHLDEYARGLSEGMTVRRGQRLGTVGSSGNADPEAPHLHFEVMRTSPAAEWWEPATSVNPYMLFTRQRRERLAQ
ncbi:MAG: M23 family metallopeptidase [Alteraurantiacibacter sp.]